MTRKLEDIVASNILRLRNENGWTQSDLAARMRSIGFSSWQANRVTQIETLRRHATMLETINLAWIFGVPLTEMFQGEGRIELPGATGDVTREGLATIRAIITGDMQQMVSLGNYLGDGAASDEIRKIAKRLGLPLRIFTWLARRVYGRSFTEERDARAGDVTGLAKRSVQAKRGNATRALVAELTGVIRAEGGAEQVRAAYVAATGWAPVEDVSKPGEGDTVPAKMADDATEDSGPGPHPGEP